MRNSLVFAILLASACNPVVEEGYLGEPLYEFSAFAEDFRAFENDFESLRTSLFWTEDGVNGTTRDVENYTGESTIGVSLRFPSSVLVRIYNAPIRAERPFEIGHIVIWNDVNESGRIEEEEYRGGTIDHLILYAYENISASDSPIKAALEQGFHLLSTDVYCDATPIPPQNTEECGVPIGASCEMDSQCGQGRCIQDDGNQIFPDGYCVLDEGGCAPKGSVIHNIDLEESSMQVWAKACQINSDCRVEDGYSCHILAQACLPAQKAFFVVDPKLEYLPLCTPPIP